MKMLLSGLFIFFLLLSSGRAQLIIIDAQKDAFYENLTGPDDGKIFLPARSALLETSFAMPEGGDADLSATIWTAWEYPDIDPGYIYYYAEVKDDTVVVNNSAASGSKWSNDKIELKYDPDPSSPDGSGLVIQVGISALDWDLAEDSVAVDNLHQDNELQKADATLWVPTPADYARRLTDDGYVLEWRIPIDYINKGSRYLSLDAIGGGKPFGTTINVADNDSAARTAMLQWSAGHADNAWSFPRQQGTATLLDGGKVKYEAVSPNDPTIINDSAQAWYYGGPTSVKANGRNAQPESFTLSQNYPNPFNPSTKIKYYLEGPSAVTLTIYNLTGNVVRNLLMKRRQGAGSHEIVWNAEDNNRRKIPSGVYFYRLNTNTAIVTKKMVYIR